jgi:ketosteroid isomerase-like protein
MPTPRDWHAWTTAFLAPWNAHDVEAVLATLPEDFSWQFPAGATSEGATYRGHAELRAWLTRFFQTVPDLNYTIVDLHPGPDLLVMEVLVTGQNIETGQKLNFQACDIVLFNGDIPREKRSYRKVVTPD